MLTATETFIIEQYGDHLVTESLAYWHLMVRRQQEAEDENCFLDILDSQADLKDVRKSYIEPGGNFWVARHAESDALAGFIGLKRSTDNPAIAHIKRTTVLPAYRRQGLATQLVREAIAWAASAGIERLALATGMKERALSLYESAGFVPVGHDCLMVLSLREDVSHA